MAESLALRPSLARARRALAALRDVWIGASGGDAYRNYLAHLHAHHPGATPMSHERFAREQLIARWDGVKRCC